MPTRPHGQLMRRRHRHRGLGADGGGVDVTASGIVSFVEADPTGDAAVGGGDGATARSPVEDGDGGGDVTPAV